MAKIKRNLIQFGSGFLGGFGSGGFWGGVGGGSAAMAAGGKAKPLKSIAIGAGVGLVTGSIAQRLGWQGQTSKIGPYKFRPLSSRLFGKRITTVADKAVEIGSKPSFNLPSFGGGSNPIGGPQYGVGSQYSLDVPETNGATGGALVDGGGSSNILPLVLIGGALLFLGAA